MGVENNITVDMTGIRQRSNGLWQARAKYTNRETRESVTYNKSGFPSFIDAYNARQQFLKDMEERGSSSMIKKRKVKDIFAEQLDNCNYAVATVKRKKSLYENHIKKVFGEKYLNTISAGEIESFLIKMSKPTKDKKFGKGITYSQEYIFGFYKWFAALYKFALKHGYVQKDVMKDISSHGTWFTKGKPRRKGRKLSTQELSVIDRELATTNLYTSFKIAIHTGLRISEIFALTWKDIDFQKNLIDVNKQLLFDGDKKIWYFAPTKTLNSVRKVPMPQELSSYLMDLRSKQLAEKERLGDCYRGDDTLTGIYDNHGNFNLVKGFEFVNIKTNGERLTSDSTKYATRKIEHTTGRHRFLLDPKDPNSSINFHYHDFRSTYATLCAENGVAVEDLQDILGHKKITTTKEFYLHKDTENNPIRDERINKIFGILNAEISEKQRVSKERADALSATESTSAENSAKEQKVIKKPGGHFVNGVYYVNEE